MPINISYEPVAALGDLAYRAGKAIAEHKAASAAQERAAQMALSMWGQQHQAASQWNLERARREEARKKDEADKAFEAWKFYKTREAVEKESEARRKGDLRMRQYELGHDYGKTVYLQDARARSEAAQAALWGQYMPPLGNVPLTPQGVVDPYGEEYNVPGF